MPSLGLDCIREVAEQPLSSGVFFFYLLQVSALASLRGGALCKGDNSFLFVLALVGILSQPQKLELCTYLCVSVCVHACACARGQPQVFFGGFETGSH